MGPEIVVRTGVDARTLAHETVAARLGVDQVRIAQVCAECGGPHGRPQVVGHDVHVSWSRSGDLAAVIVADEPCAIDVETLPLRHPAPVDLLSAAEQAWIGRQQDRESAFARLWTRKEVLVKVGRATLDEALATDVRTDDTILDLDLDLQGRHAVGAWAVTSPATTEVSPRTSRGHRADT